MAEEDRTRETAMRLRRLVDEIDLSEADRVLAGLCLRRLEQPLRLTVFGTDIGHAVSLLNLMIGQSVISPTIRRARIQFVHGQEPHARLLFRDGSQKRIDGSQFRRLFDENPNRMRIYVDLPVLRKISITVAADQNPRSLCADADKTLLASDVAIWAGAELHDSMRHIWTSIPQRLRDHSYLTLAPGMDISTWQDIQDEFAGVFRVAPRRAQEAKTRPEGVDKAAFREAGGTELVKTMKSEIDMLTRSAIDAGEVLLIRYAKELEAAAHSGKSQSSAVSPEDALALVSQMRRPASVEVKPRIVSEVEPVETAVSLAVTNASIAPAPDAEPVNEPDTTQAFEPANAPLQDMSAGDIATPAPPTEDADPADTPLPEPEPDEVEAASPVPASQPKPTFDFGAALDASLKAKVQDPLSEEANDDLPEDVADDVETAATEALEDAGDDDSGFDDLEALIARVSSAPSQDSAKSVELGKVASRSRLLGYANADDSERPPVSGFTAESMPLRTRAKSKLNAQSRVRSRTSRPSATPWSLDL